jgi:tetratricopeptide (TPR) repeat protein
LVVPAQLDPGQADGSLCAEADVFHGDSRQDAGRVQVQVTPAEQPDTFNIRITSSALIDEPVVTVYLRAGCNQKISRKFVLLADFPGDTAAPQARINTPTVQAVPTVIPVEPAGQPMAPANAAAQAGTGQTSIAKAASLRAKPLNTVPASAQENTPRSAAPAAEAVPPKAARSKRGKAAIPEAEAPAKPAAIGKPRLRLDPIETLSERVKSLESTTTASAVQDESAGDGKKLQQLQTDLKSLLDQASKNEASLAAMRDRLEKAESERVPVAMVYALLALVLACAAALAYLWTRRPKRVVWEEPEQAVAPAREALQTAPAAVAAVVSSPKAMHADLHQPDTGERHYAGMPNDQAPEISATATNKRVLPKTKHPNFQTEEQLDLRQHAELLANLGRIDEALEMLEAGIRNSPSESPLLILDLLGIAHSHSRKTDFRQFRDEFTQLFNATVPEFALFKNEGRALDAYPALLEHINSQWESPRVLDIIEACIQRDPDATESDPFDLAAFRELVNMHGVAREHHAVKS